MEITTEVTGRKNMQLKSKDTHNCLEKCTGFEILFYTCTIKIHN